MFEQNKWIYCTSRWIPLVGSLGRVSGAGVGCRGVYGSRSVRGSRFTFALSKMYPKVFENGVSDVPHFIIFPGEHAPPPTPLASRAYYAPKFEPPVTKFWICPRISPASLRLLGGWEGSMPHSHPLASRAFKYPLQPHQKYYITHSMKKFAFHS